MQNSLPDRVDFLKQVERNTGYEGTLPVSVLGRLAQGLVSQEGVVTAQLKFSTRAGVPCLDGRVEAELELECQRCLDPVAIVVKGDFRFGLVRDEDEITELPEEFEPLLLEEGEQSLYDLIEDELILSLPIVSRHDGSCSDELEHLNEGKSAEETYKPFAGLKDLMTED